MSFTKFVAVIVMMHICVYITVDRIMAAWVPTINNDTGVVVLDFLVALWGISNLAGNLAVCAVLYGAVLGVPALAVLAFWSASVFARDYLGVSVLFSVSAKKMN